MAGSMSDFTCVCLYIFFSSLSLILSIYCVLCQQIHRFVRVPLGRLCAFFRFSLRAFVFNTRFFFTLVCRVYARVDVTAHVHVLNSFFYSAECMPVGVCIVHAAMMAGARVCFALYLSYLVFYSFFFRFFFVVRSPVVWVPLATAVASAIKCLVVCAWAIRAACIML